MKSGPKTDLETTRRRFERSYIPEPNTGCWISTGTKINSGYCLFGMNGGAELAHRAAWMLHKGPIPDGLWVLHKCDFKPCVNYENHLFLGTNSINQLDALSKGIKTGISCYHEKQRARTHCHANHEFTVENTRVDSRGCRHCRKCHSNRAREKRAAARAYAHALVHENERKVIGL